MPMQKVSLQGQRDPLKSNRWGYFKPLEPVSDAAVGQVPPRSIMPFSHAHPM
jgi:hypothetical protein